ncbi:transposable element Tc3 transposase [Trichonephila clavipes]|nr:transposable element Tc3 transposase [Trichonephila clavipes]
MDWPAYSPDLNPIEHVWDALGRCIVARLHHPENTQQLKQILIEEWALLPQEMLHQLVLITRPSTPEVQTESSTAQSDVKAILRVEESLSIL